MLQSEIKERINLIFMDIESRLWSKDLTTNQEEIDNEHFLSVIKRLKLGNTRILLDYSQNPVGVSDYHIFTDISIEDEHAYTEIVRDLEFQIDKTFIEPTLDFVEKFYEHNLELIRELLEKRGVKSGLTSTGL